MFRRKERKRRARHRRRDILGYQTRHNVDQLSESKLAVFEIQTIIGAYLDEGEGRVAFDAAEREEEVAIQEKQTEEEERQTSLIREAISLLRRTQPPHRSPSAESSSASSSVSPSRPGSPPPRPRTDPSGGASPTAYDIASSHNPVARREQPRSDYIVHMGPTDIDPEFPDGVVTVIKIQMTTASPPNPEVSDHDIISSIRKDEPGLSRGSGHSSKHDKVEEETGTLDRQRQVAEHIRLPQDIPDRGSTSFSNDQTRLRGGEESLNYNPRPNPRLDPYMALGSKVDEAQKCIDLHFFYHERGKVCAGKRHQYTSFKKSRNDKQLIGLLRHQYDNIKRKNQSSLSIVLSLKTIGFVNFLRFEALKDSSDYRLSAKRGIFEYIDSRSSSRFAYILQHGPSKHSRTWIKNLDILIGTASHQDIEGDPTIVVELVESFNTRKILRLISFAIISSLLFGAIAGFASKNVGNGVSVSGYILSSLGAILAIGGAGTWVGLTRPDSFSFAYDIDERSIVSKRMVYNLQGLK